MTTKARTDVDSLGVANAHLKKKLAEALEQQTATTRPSWSDIERQTGSSSV
jgi:hypothetical protein